MKKIFVMSLSISLVCSSLVGCGSGAGSAQAQSYPSAPATKDLSSFKNTYWYVPANYLLAYKFDNKQTPTITQVSDQTVWQIKEASNGYLTGCSFTSTDNGATWSSATIVGSVTVENKVSLGFYGTSLVVGQGTLVSAYNQPAFLMQMSAGNGISGLTHWAYMLPVTPQDPTWNNLPGTNSQSVSTVISAGC